ncbi:hypothetical protein C8Q73DRAFT_444829 [Cubamyces lactineus]|nr:hypothetical protein C8Q73DRAFT_444829 [Cubamyces lactineus]
MPGARTKCARPPGRRNVSPMPSPRPSNTERHETPCGLDAATSKTQDTRNSQQHAHTRLSQDPLPYHARHAFAHLIAPTVLRGSPPVINVGENAIHGIGPNQTIKRRDARRAGRNEGGRAVSVEGLPRMTCTAAHAGGRGESEDIGGTLTCGHGRSALCAQCTEMDVRTYGARDNQGSGLDSWMATQEENARRVPVRLPGTATAVAAMLRRTTRTP